MNRRRFILSSTIVVALQTGSSSVLEKAFQSDTAVLCASCRRKASNHYQGTGWHCMNSSHGFGVTPISRLDDKAILHQ